MNAEEFVSYLQERAVNSATNATLEYAESPGGSPPKDEWLQAQQWLSTLDYNSKERLKFLIHDAARQAVFGVLCILDGVRVVSDEQVPPQDGEFVLEFRTKESCVRLNDGWLQGGGPFLHDLL